MKQGWKIKKLGEVCEVLFGTRVVHKRDGGSVYFVYGGGGATFKMDTYNRENCLVVARFAMSKQCTRFIKGKFFLNDSGLTIHPLKNNILQSFINYQLLFLNDNIYALGKGAAQKNLDTNALKNISVKFPISLSEQERIIGILDNAFAKIEAMRANAEQSLQNAKALFQASLKQELTPKQGWQDKKIGDIGKISMCKRVLKEQTTSNGEIPFYKIGTFGKVADAFISKDIYTEFKNKFSFPKKGNILISASGTIGRRVKYDGEPAYFQDSNIVWVDNDEEQVLDNYLFYCYGACEWKATNGATISRLYNENLRQINISFPIEHEEQQSIVEKLDALSERCRAMEDNYRQTLAACNDLKQALLKKAFNGEL